jgi:hypothetical protein
MGGVGLRFRPFLLQWNELYDTYRTIFRGELIFFELFVVYYHRKYPALFCTTNQHRFSILPRHPPSAMRCFYTGVATDAFIALL